MADLISAIASTALESLASSALQEVASAWHFESNLLKLTNTIRTIKDVLVADNDEGHQPHGLNNIIKRLKDTIYEADDLLDKFTTLVERKRLMTSHGVFTKEVRIFFSSDNQVATALTISSKIKRIRKALDDIVGDREQFATILPSNEQVVESWSVIKERESCSFVVDEDIIGRGDDKQKILDVLLRDDHSDPTTHIVVVIPIVGIGGLGKTTVAQLAFNDEDVKSYFELKLWVCIGDVVGLKVIIKKMMSAIESSCPIKKKKNKKKK